MQTICQVRPRPEEFLGPFFPVTAGILVTSPQRHGGAGHHGASRGLTRLHWASLAAQGITRLHGSPDSGSKGDFGYSFGSRFGSKIFLEQLCFSINSSILPLLLPMLPKNPQKVSRIGDSCKPFAR